MDDTVKPKVQKTTEEKLAEAARLKEEGNKLFQTQEYKKAIDRYHRAHLYLKGFDSTGANPMLQMAGGGRQNLSEEHAREVKDLSKAVFLNMAVCHLKVEKADRAIEDCNNALALDPQNVKAFFRRGQAYLLKRDVERAGEDLNKAATLSPGDKGIQQELKRQKQMEAQQNERQRKAFAGMFDKMNKDEAN